MDAFQLQQLCDSNRRSNPAENDLYLLGATIKRVARETVKEEPIDADGHLLQDDELYCVTEQGIWRVEA